METKNIHKMKENVEKKNASKSPIVVYNYKLVFFIFAIHMQIHTFPMLGYAL